MTGDHIAQYPHRTGLWQPTRADETDRLLNRILPAVPEAERSRVAEEAIAVLGQCSPPGSATPRTGLILGYVQSGKTLSFTTVGALAQDNGFDLIVLVAGSSDPLLAQSRARLADDLGRNEPRVYLRWDFIDSPRVDTSSHRRFLDRVRSADAATSPTLLVTVMKQHRHLASLTEVLRAVGPELLGRVPSLIIDDEADQAGLNTKAAKGLESALYAQLLALRACLPQHSYLQYTATPQAPLLISIADTLSPDFVKVLTPGRDYMGGREFFSDGSLRVRAITDTPAEDDLNAGPPESLLEALRVFVLGAAANLLAEQPEPCVSMMIHPSRTVPPHDRYETWVQGILKRWHATLEAGTGGDYQDLLEEFTVAWRDLAQTASGIPSLPELIDGLHEVLRHARTEVMNTQGRRRPGIGSTSSNLPWTASPAWILIGGQMLDRGFTVEGLTVTYMPRGLGLAHTDSVQQRGRFFGYKRRYFGLCRVFLEPGVETAFRTYVEHEQNIRGQMQALERSGRSLRDWKRAFLLDQSMRPTRRQVLKDGYVQTSVGEDWFRQEDARMRPEAIQRNQATIARVRQAWSWRQLADHRLRTAEQQHRVAQMPAQEAFELLVSQYEVGSDDLIDFLGLQLQLKTCLEAEIDPGATVYLIGDRQPRVRTVPSGGKYKLMQGRTKSGSSDHYPGDAAIRIDDRLCIQIHLLALAQADSEERRGQEYPALAIWVPASMSKDTLVSRQVLR